LGHFIFGSLPMSMGTTIRNSGMLVLCAVFLSCGLALPASAREDASATKPGTHSTSGKTNAKKRHVSSSAVSTKNHSSKRRRKSSRVRGQQKIASDRAQAIQEALIQKHYLRGEATGTWDQASEEAMRRFQRDNGWQDKTVPDSRALIKLGLGPNTDHLLNPESAMTTVPDRPKADPIPTTSHSSPAVANPPQPTAPASTPVSSDSSQPQ
jgi:Putative peptidoglycan binding domain